jgi:hypothetical protein
LHGAVTDAATPASASLALRLYRVLALVAMVLVLVLAVMAGRSDALFGSWDIEVHGYVGNTVFAIAVVMVVLSFLTQTRGVVVGHAVAFAALTFAQIGLGYVGRESAEAAARHIPNGVLLMGIATAHFSLLRPDRG